MPHLKQIVIASHNKGKIREIGELLSPLGVVIKSVSEFGLPVPDETETTFAGNARIKALSAASATGIPALSDDSGLAIDAINGAPGVYAADWAEIPASEGGGRDFNMAMWHVNRLMSENNGPDTARFICALCLAWPDGTTKVYEGKVEGRIVWPPRGTKGFGYDPIFQALGDTQTFAEIEPSVKHAKSHRADAFAKFLDDLFPNG